MGFLATLWSVLSILTVTLHLEATTSVAASVSVFGRSESNQITSDAGSGAVADPRLEGGPQRKLKFLFLEHIADHIKMKIKGKPRSLFEWWQAAQIRKGLSPSWEVFRKDRIICIKSKVTEKVEEEQSADVHANALEEAIVTACNSGEELKVEGVRKIIEARGDAYALAKASARARIACGTLDIDAYECFEVEASAEAFAEASLKVHANAVARAVTRCNCSSEATAEAELSATVYGKLVAEAAVKATANVCVDGVGTVKDEAWETCTSAIYAELLAQAVVDALAFGDCLAPVAAAAVEADATAEVTAESTCGMRAEFIEAPAAPPPPG